MSVYLSACIPETQPNFTALTVTVVLLWQHCDMLCTSGYMDGITVC